MTDVLRGAVERGITFFDTAEVYGPFTNEVLVRALRSLIPRRRDDCRPNSASTPARASIRAAQEARPG